MATIEQQSILEMVGLTKYFAGNCALAGVDFAIARGEIHALLGQNGAGKSTLIKILAGVYGADEGEIRLRGTRVDPTREALPVSFIHQDLGLFAPMSVAENVAMAIGYPRRRGLISWRNAREAAAKALAAMGSDIDPDSKVGELQPAERSIVAIARALAVQADILVLDEPTSALPAPDVAVLLEALRRLRQQNIGIVYVTHRLDEVFAVADRATVLRDGRRIASMPIGQTSPDDLVTKIVGRKLAAAAAPVRGARDGHPVLDVDRLCVDDVGPVSLSIGPGEAVGLVGLRGAGHATVGRAIFGDRAAHAGTILIDGKPLNPKSTADAIARGVGLVPGKRLEEAAIGEMSVRENLYLNPSIANQDAGWLNPSTEKAAAAERVRAFTVRPNNTETPILTLSGGNQQKVILARWMQHGTRLLILEEPTSGVDVGAKAEIYALLAAAEANGTAVLLVSSDFEEIERACHRALVFDRGRIVAELSGAEITTEALTHAASGTPLLAKAVA